MFKKLYNKIVCWVSGVPEKAAEPDIKITVTPPSTPPAAEPKAPVVKKKAAPAKVSAKKPSPAPAPKALPQKKPVVIAKTAPRTPKAKQVK